MDMKNQSLHVANGFRAFPRRLWPKPAFSERSGKGHFCTNQPTQKATGRRLDADSREACEPDSAASGGHGEGNSDRQVGESG